jgi:hypothetical protein
LKIERRGRTFVILKKHLGRHAEQDLPDRLEMGAACLDLLRERVHVAEAALERAAREDRVDARSLVGQVCHLGRDRVGAGEPHAGPIGDIDRRHVVGMRVDRGERLDQIRLKTIN